MEIVCGIYEIKNLIDNKRYIGQSVNIYKRWKSHRCELNNNDHKNSYLQNAWNKYGEKNFKFSILNTCNQEDLDSKEIYYITLHNTTNEDLGYNLTSGGNSQKIISGRSIQKMIDIRWTDQKRKENADRIIGANNPMFGKTGSQNPESKAVICINTGEMFESLKLAAKWCDLKNSPMIGQVCRGIRKTAGKHPITGEKLRWKFVNEDDKTVSSRKQGSYLSEDAKNKIRIANKGRTPHNKNLRLVYCVELDKVFKNATEASQELGIKSSLILACCRHDKNRKTCGGYHWEFAENITNQCKRNEVAL